MSINWDLIGEFITGSMGSGSFNITAITNNSPPYIVSNFGVGSQITYGSNSYEVELINPGGYLDNDNKMDPFNINITFTSGGLAFREILTPSNEYNFHYINSLNSMTNTLGDIDAPITVLTACFLQGTKILTENGYKPIEDLKKDDLIVSTTEKILKKITLIVQSPVTLNSMPFIIPQDNEQIIEDIFISQGHSFFFNKRWGGASDHGFSQASMEDLLKNNFDVTLCEDKKTFKKILYYNIKLEGDRKINTIYANTQKIEFESFNNGLN